MYGLTELVVPFQQIYIENGVINKSSPPLTIVYRSTTGGLSQRPYTSTLNYTSLRGSQLPKAFSIEAPADVINPARSCAGSCGVNLFPLLYPEGFAQLCEVDVERMARDVNNDLLDELAGNQFQSPVWLAELGKTGEAVHSLAERARVTAKWLSGLKPSSWRKLVIRKETALRVRGSGLPDQILSRLGDAWMVWRYSICTTLLDVEDAIKTYVDVNHQVDGYTRVQARKRRSGSSFINATAPDNPYLLNIIGSFHAHATVRFLVDCVVKGWAHAKISDPNLRYVHHLGLNPLSVAWELLPGSFIADWALNVGSWLNNLSSTLGLSIRDGGIGTSIAVKGTTTQYHDGGSSVAVSWNVDSYNRVRSIPANRWSLSDTPMNYKRWLDAASIFRSLGESRGLTVRALTRNH